MRTPNVIYLQVCPECDDKRCEQCPVKFDELSEITWCVDEINDTDAVYFSEQAVRELLRKEYKQANNVIRFASRSCEPVDEDLIEVEASVESAIKQLKGEKK